MTVLEPTTPDCPMCGSTELGAEVTIYHTIHTDGEGGIARVDPSPDSFGSFQHMECEDCGYILIKDGEIVNEAVTGCEI